jgi:hypothetical protein
LIKKDFGMSMQRGFAVGLRLAVVSLGMFMLASCGGGGGGGGGTPAVLSSNADLNALSVSATGTLTPVFAASTMSYSLTTASTTADTTVTATVADSGASLTINGVTATSGVASSAITLTANATTTINIVVTAADSSSKTYSVLITRPISHSANLSVLSLSTGVIAPAFDPATLSGYTSTLGFLASRVRVLTTTQDNTASVTVNGQLQTATGVEVPLVEGTTTIDVTVTAVGITPQTYTLSVERQTLATFKSHQFETVTAGVTSSANANFGNAVVVHGNTMVIGAPQAPLTTGNYDGAVYVFVRDIAANSWVYKQTLRANNSLGGAFFGQSVVFDGTSIIVGAPNLTHATPNCLVCGAVYVYTQDMNGDWMEHQVLYATVPSADQGFGNALAMAGTTLIIGAPGGKATYVFTRNTAGTWNELTKLVADIPEIGIDFGISVAFDGKHIVIGAQGAADVTNALVACGAAYVFDDSSGVWIQQDILRATDPTEAAYFGHSVAMEGDTIVVGSPFATFGAVYVFQPANTAGKWSQIQKLTPRSPVQYDQFGSAVAIQGDILIIGALNETYSGSLVPNSGNAYLFARNTGSTNWSQTTLVRAAPSATNGAYGIAVNLQGDELVVGASGMLGNTGWAFTVK